VPRNIATPPGGGVQALVPSPEATAPAVTSGSAVATWFTFGRARLDGSRLRVALRLPADGALRAGGRVRIKGRRAMRIRARRLQAGAGRARVTIRIPRAARRALRGGKAARARVVVRVSYRPEEAGEWRRRKLTLTLIAGRSRSG
jgi:hypothetical protein